MVFSLDEEFSEIIGHEPLSQPTPSLTINENCFMMPAGKDIDDNEEVLSFSDEDDGIGRTKRHSQPYHKNLMHLNPVAVPVVGIDYAHDGGLNETVTVSSIRRRSSGRASQAEKFSISNPMNTTRKLAVPESFSNSPEQSTFLHSSVVTKNSKLARRRSSVLSRLSVNTPPNVTRIDLAYEEKDTDSLDEDEDVVPISLDSTGYFIDETLSSTTPNINIRGTDKKSHHVRRKLEDFQPVRVLGQGAYGKVILVKDQYNSKLYALKQLRKAEILLLPDDETAETEKGGMSPRSKRIERTFAERSILSELEHPNIVKLFYSFHDNDKLYLLLQYLPGGELFFHLKNLGNLQEDTVAFYTAEISLAVKFLHEKGIVYRDLKPENCLLNARGHLVLTDFGLSKSGAGSDGSFYSIIGTPEYAAPEILQGTAYTKSSDWYSLGCLVYDMLIGKPPHTGQNPKMILSKIMKNTVNLPYYLSDGMKDFLNALLKKDVDKRWDVDMYWDELKSNGNSDKNKKNNKKKKKAGAAKTTPFKQHFIFRKINWAQLDNINGQKTTWGPILPVITDWALAENFDLEFTGQRLTNADIRSVDITTTSNTTNDNLNEELFKGFSFVASSSYLEKYF